MAFGKKNGYFLLLDNKKIKKQHKKVIDNRPSRGYYINIQATK